MYQGGGQTLNNKKMWRTPDCAGGGSSSEDYLNQMAKGNFTRGSTGTQKQLRLLDQVKHTGLYPNANGGGYKMEGQLNPDWTEWLMLWTVGWTDLKPMDKEKFEQWRLKVLSGEWPSIDPAELPKENEGYISRLTMDKTHRADRLKAIGNGQVPLCCYAATLLLSNALSSFNNKTRSNA